MKIQTIKNKNLPYYTCPSYFREREIAAALRREILPKMQRRLPGHHLLGLPHDYIVKFVARNKNAYPYYIKGDIAKFYPSIRHQDIVTGFQIAYRDLLGLPYVPEKFRKCYVPGINAWAKQLPLTRGIPLGSSLSAILAPLMLVPLWLRIKREFQVPFIVYMDDFLILCENQEKCNRIYVYIENYLSRNYDLILNPSKTKAGRLSKETVDFCGWRMAGGYVSIAPEKVEAFKGRIHNELASCRRSRISYRAGIKRVNRKIDGFGNYYKHGHVARLFETLDSYIRREVRTYFAQSGASVQGWHTTSALQKLGLHALQAKYERIHKKQGATKSPVTLVPALARSTSHANRSAVDDQSTRQLELLDKLLVHTKELVSLQRKQLHALQTLCVMEQRYTVDRF